MPRRRIRSWAPPRPPPGNRRAVRRVRPPGPSEDPLRQKPDAPDIGQQLRPHSGRTARARLPRSPRPSRPPHPRRKPPSHCLAPTPARDGIPAAPAPMGRGRRMPMPQQPSQPSAGHAVPPPLATGRTTQRPTASAGPHRRLRYLPSRPTLPQAARTPPALGGSRHPSRTANRPPTVGSPPARSARRRAKGARMGRHNPRPLAPGGQRPGSMPCRSPCVTSACPQ